MVASLDGRIHVDRWWPKASSRSAVFAHLHDDLNCGAWLVGRVTGQEYAKLEAYPAQAEGAPAKETWFATRDSRPRGIILDPHAKIAWGRSDIEGDPLVVVLTSTVAEAHLEGLQKDGVSYIIAGEMEIDLGLTLTILRRELGIERLEVNGGAITNGAFLRAGLVDEISLALFPAIDGTPGAPGIFDVRGAGLAVGTAPEKITLQSSDVLEGGVVRLRYRVQNC
jgi:riboflavin biosynthesis pyrimidine reductase